MDKYIVARQQNIWDVALAVHGTIEGVFDLLVSNPWLSINTDLTKDIELNYHSDYILNSDMVAAIKEKGFTPANGYREVYFTENLEPLRFVIKVDKGVETINFSIRCLQDIKINWGDGNSLETYYFTNTNQLEGSQNEVNFDAISKLKISHTYSDISTVKNIKIYSGEQSEGFYDAFRIDVLDISELQGIIYPLREFYINKLIAQNTKINLMGVNLYKQNVMTLDFSGSYLYGDPFINLEKFNVVTLILHNASFESTDILDNLLKRLESAWNKNKIWHLVIPKDAVSEVGMEYINKIQDNRDLPYTTFFSTIES